MEDCSKNNKINTYNSTKANFDKKSFGLNTSYILFKSDNPSFKTNNIFSPFDFGSEYINTYDDSDKQYKILDKGLSIIYDTFSNEYSVYILNLSTIDTNSFYNEIIINFNNSIKYYIEEIFNEHLIDQKFDVKNIIENILNYFDNYFFKSRIFPNLRRNIYEKVHLELKNNLLKYIENKYLDKSFDHNQKENNFSKNNSCSTKSNLSTNLTNRSLLQSSIFNINNDFDENINTNYDAYKKEIVTYIQNNLECNSKSLYNDIEQKVEYINEKINIYELFESIDNWHKEHINTILENDNAVKDEMLNVKIKMNNRINIPFSFNHLKRCLLSYSLQYDWGFIKKVKNIENYIKSKNINENEDNDDIEMEMNNNNEIGENYFNDLDNLGNMNNINDFVLNDINNFDNIGNINNNFAEYNLKNSFFDY